MSFSRRIDAKKKDHVIDSATGRWERDLGIGTSVHLALATEQGSHVPDPTFGSKLHLLRGEKLLTTLNATAVAYAREALRRLERAGRIRELKITADREATRGFLVLLIEGKDDSARDFRFEHPVRVGA